MIHLVYLDNKEKVLEKIMSGKKTMIIRGAAGRIFLIVEYSMTKYYISWKKELKK